MLVRLQQGNIRLTAGICIASILQYRHLQERWNWHVNFRGPLSSTAQTKQTGGMQRLQRPRGRMHLVLSEQAPQQACALESVHKQAT